MGSPYDGLFYINTIEPLHRVIIDQTNLVGSITQLLVDPGHHPILDLEQSNPTETMTLSINRLTIKLGLCLALLALSALTVNGQLYICPVSHFLLPNHPTQSN